MDGVIGRALSRRAFTLAAVAAAYVIAGASQADAAVGDLTFADCASNDGSGGICADIPGSSAFAQPQDAVVSPDGDSLYVAASVSSSVSHFFVAPSGQLTFGGCVSNDGSGGACTDVPGSAFDSSGTLAISPDGDSLYVGSGNSSSVTHFFAAPQGQLTFGGCVSNNGSGGTCTDVPGTAFDAPAALAISPDGTSLYVASVNSNSVSHFFAAPQGQITFGGCVSNDGSGGTCTDVPGAAFEGPRKLAVSPNGNSLYVASRFSNSVSHFFAAPQGQITFGGCVSNDGSGGACTDVPGSAFDIPAALAMSPDGQSLFVAAQGSNSLTHFRAAPQGQITFASCISNGGSAGSCADLPGSVLDGPLDVVVAPGGSSVYAPAASSNTVAHFSREQPTQPPSADTDPPGLTLKVGKQQAGKPVKVTVSCDEACMVDVTGSAKPKGARKGKLKPKSAQLAAGEQATLTLKPKGKLGKSLRRSGKGKATLHAVAADASGNSADATKRVKLK